MHPVSEKDGVQSAIQPSYTDPCHKEEHPPVHTQPTDCTQSSNITRISHSRVHREAPGLGEGRLPQDKAHLHNGIPSKLSWCVLPAEATGARRITVTFKGPGKVGREVKHPGHNHTTSHAPKN